MHTLHLLLDRQLDLPPEYGPGLSNHLPMALHALHALGAPPARLQAFHDQYAARFGERRAPPPAPPPDDWRSARGDIDAYPALLAAFRAQVQRDGTVATLRQALPALWPGAAGAAFHGLIRTAHAVQSGHAGETAAALAYWAARWQPMPPVRCVAPHERIGFGAGADALDAAARQLRPSGRLISGRVATAVQSADYATLASRLAVDGLQALADWAAATYAASGNFTVLHLVTATRAARVLMPFGDDTAAMLRGFARAFIAGALASHLEAATAEPPRLTWEQVRDAAIAADDDHLIKVVHALCDERSAYGDGPRLAAACRAIAAQG